MAKKKNKRPATSAGGIRKHTHPKTQHPAAAKLQKQQHKHTTPTKPKQTQSKQSRQSVIPFHTQDKVLLIGEGDFSFTSSLLKHHSNRFDKLVATTLESPETLQEKHPDIMARLDDLREHTKCSGIFHNIDATKLNEYKFIKRVSGKGGYDRIVFNFPHVGGKSTDVNRQVRYNQEMLVKFFGAAMALLSTRKSDSRQKPENDRSERYSTDEEGDGATDDELENTEEDPQPASSILVTLFEGEPYTLWNIKDLARHIGLAVTRSYAFQASMYPGYQHARTLGELRGKAAWKGEHRSARTFEFVLKEEKAPPGSSKKRKNQESSSEEDDG